MAKRKLSNNILFKFIRESYQELKKVAWPKRSEVIRKAIIVVVSMIVVAAIIGLLDYGLYQGVKVLLGIN